MDKKLDKTIESVKELETATVKLREIVNNGLATRVSSIQKFMYWFIGMWITVTGATFGILFWIIKLVTTHTVG